MRRFWPALGLTAATLLAVFTAVETAGVGWLTDPGAWLAGGGVAAAAGGVGLLVADVALPVPSSLVMVAHGAVFGAAAGAALSLTGVVMASLAAHEAGRRGRRLLPPDELARARRLLDRHGLVAVVVTRPVPILAETTALAAGMASMPRPRVALAALLGGLPPATVYALAGAQVTSLDHPLVVVAAVGVLGLAAWLAGARNRAPAGTPAG